ncbi:hypothetical protein [Psychrobacillus sp. L3]
MLIECGFFRREIKLFFMKIPSNWYVCIIDYYFTTLKIEKDRKKRKNDL